MLGLAQKQKVWQDKMEYAGTVFMDLSEAFDTINHKLQQAKQNAYGFAKNSLQIIRNYLSNH